MRRCMCDPRLIPGPLVFHLETTKPVENLCSTLSQAPLVL